MPAEQMALPHTAMSLVADRLGTDAATVGGEPAVHVVTVARAELQRALRLLIKFYKAKDQGEAILTFAEGELHIELVGSGVSVPANGRWDGEVRVPGMFMVAMAKALPPENPMPIFVEAGRLHMGRQSAPCIVQRAAQKRIELAINAPLADILRVRLSCSDAEIERSGLSRLVRDAEHQRDAMIERAAEQLRKLEVRREDLRHLVDESLRRALP